MRVLVVYNDNYYNEVRPFISEQVDGIREKGIGVDYFPIQQRGLLGYLRVRGQLRITLRRNNYALIKAKKVLSRLIINKQIQQMTEKELLSLVYNLWENLR